MSAEVGGLEETDVVEVHSTLCECGGGCWFVHDGLCLQCRGPHGETPEDSILASRADWERLGRPQNSEAYEVARRHAGERRRSSRFSIALRVRIERPSADVDGEETETEQLGEGGALVVTSLRLSHGELVRFADLGGLFVTEARIQSVFVGDDDRLRVSLMFLDGNVSARVREIVCRRTERSSHGSQDSASRR